MTSRRSRIAARARALPPRAVDACLAALVFVEGSAELLILAGGAGAPGVPMVALVALGMLVRRRFPIAAVVLALFGIFLSGLLPREAVEGSGGPFLAVIFLVFSMALRVEGRRLWAGAAITFAGAAISSFTDQWENDGTDLIFIACLFVAAPVAAGRLLQSRAALAAALEDKAARVERDRGRRAAEAVAEERERIAGELHDVVAHALGAMTVQASAARRLTTGDADSAREAFRAVEDTGRDALGELRRLLGVLRREDEELALAPQPRLAYLRDLARRTSAAGLPVEVEVEGEAPSLPAGVDLTAFRVVQEALAEALEHGGAGRASVRVRYAPGDVVLEVLDDGRGDDRQLLGMRERVRVYGGDLTAESRRDGGHRVWARLPVEAPG